MPYSCPAGVQVVTYYALCLALCVIGVIAQLSAALPLDQGAGFSYRYASDFDRRAHYLRAGVGFRIRSKLTLTVNQLFPTDTPTIVYSTQLVTGVDGRPLVAVVLWNRLPGNSTPHSVSPNS